MVVSGPVVSTVNVWEAGVPSVLPTSSMPRTAKEWVPSESGLVVKGDVQVVNEEPSTEHSKTAAGSSAEKPNVGVLSAVVEPSAGPESIVVSGAPRSTSKLRLAGVASVLPALSVARTAKVWRPAERLGVVKGEAQALKAAPSTEHSNVELASSEENSKVGVAVAIVEPSAGPESIVVWGFVTSTVKLWLAGVASVFPAPSVARTSNVCDPSLRTLVVNGLEQLWKGSESTRHSKLEPLSVEWKAKVGVASFVGPKGPESMIVSGATVSTAQVRDAVSVLA